MPTLIFKVQVFKAQASKALILLTVLFAFVGQAFATLNTMPCETGVDSHLLSESEQHILDLTHITVDADIAEHNEASEGCCYTDCCQLGCLCLASGCVNLAYISFDIDDIQVLFDESSALGYQFQQLYALTSSLYRPPIFTS